ncbi:F-box/FBD/LRR-repeat protein [Thalictrum thalictroides]|uniref:F-box/FBD/LRR-repeat protein n=1 Tax=Thalictrum thalictroides TaxID=46969 RepID=A0A7J6X7N7_THATH|nr:F-box/FBD/LRR-repeat protein [Thalictrum thalictroides]
MTNSGSTSQSRTKKTIPVHPGPDFLSNLPDNIIEDILHHLPIIDSARTSVLANKWRYKWLGITQLLFDEHCMKLSARRILTDKLASIVNSILAQHQGKILKFKLSVLYCNTDNAKTYIHKWIDILSNRGLRDLTLENQIGIAVLVGDWFYGCEQLEVLKLKCWTIELNNSFNTFKHLKDLHLEKVNFSADDFKSLTSRCPLLEKLTVIEIAIPRLEVRCSKLKYLHAQGVFYELRIENGEHLKFLLIHQSTSIVIVRSFQQKVKETFTLQTVFASLASIESLEVWSHSLEFFAVGQIPMSLPNMLDCVKDIFMAVNIMDLRQIAAAFCLIRSSPNLKRLRIGAWIGQMTYNAVEVANFWDKHNGHRSCFDHLNIVKVEQSTCEGFEVEFISYLLKNSPALEQMTVEVLDSIPDEDIMLFEQNLLIEGRSPQTKIEVSKTTKRLMDYPYGWALMVALGFNELAAAHPRTAKFSVVVVVIFSIVIGMILSLILLILRKLYPYAFSIVINSVQPVLSGVMGVWVGMITGTVVQTAILFSMTYRTNWNKEASYAKMRIKQWKEEARDNINDI